MLPGNVQRELAFSSVLSLHESSMDESSPFLRRASRTSEASGEQMGRPRLLKVQDTWKEGLEFQHIGFHYCGNLYRFLGQEGEIDIRYPSLRSVLVACDHETLCKRTARVAGKK